MHYMLVTSITLPLQAASNGRNYMHDMAHYMLSKILMYARWVLRIPDIWNPVPLVQGSTRWYVLVRASTSSSGYKTLQEKSKL